jgi:hypothetical protein
MTIPRMGLALALASAGLCETGTALASENDSQAYALGYQSTLAGYAPPTGFYFRDDIIYVTADRLNDQNGHQAKLTVSPFGSFPTSFSVRQAVSLSNLYYIAPWTVPVLNAEYGASFILPIFFDSKDTLDSAIPGVTTINRASNHVGQGDINVSPAIFGWHFPAWNLHVLAIPSTFYLPTGLYNRNDPAGNTLSRNYFTFQPSVALTYLDETRGQELSVALYYDVNTTNPATSYHSGQEFHFDYALAQHLGRMWTLGIGGYYWRQTTGDTLHGTEVNTTTASALALGGGPGNIGETFSLGPIVDIALPDHTVLKFSWDHELFTYNRPQGDVIYSRIVVRF